MRLRYRIPLAVIAIMLVATMFLGSSYAYWKATAYQTYANVLESGCFSVEFTEQSNSVNLINSYPLTDKQGLATRPYSFTVTNTCTVNAEYTIYLNTLQVDGTKIDDSLISYALTNSVNDETVANKLNTATVNTDTSSFSYDKTLLTSYVLDSQVVPPDKSVSYDLRLWIDEDATTVINSQKFEAGIASVAYASTKPITVLGALCQRATELHSANVYECGGSYSNTASCSTSVATTYGSLGTSGILLAGDAFDCDVNGDGTYDSKTERFYYVSDYYDTSTGEFNSEYATLIYSNNTCNGVIDNVSTTTLNASGTPYPWDGAALAINHLPTTSQWSNVELLKTTRYFNTQTGIVTSNTLDYSGHAARFLNHKEIQDATGLDWSSLEENGSLGKTSDYRYLLENTSYSSSSNTEGYWLENFKDSSDSVYYVYSYHRSVEYGRSSPDIGVRPAIDVAKSDIDY